jgi:replication-associated recombination protein RarA
MVQAAAAADIAAHRSSGRFVSFALCVIYLAQAPKSNSVLAYGAAAIDAAETAQAGATASQMRRRHSKHFGYGRKYRHSMIVSKE